MEDASRTACSKGAFVVGLVVVSEIVKGECSFLITAALAIGRFI